MKEIVGFELASEKRCSNLRVVGINPTMYWAYRDSKECGNEMIDFHEVIWEEDIAPIVDTCRANKIRAFTISSTFSSLIEILAKFEELGCKMNGLTQVKAKYTDWKTGENAVIPAIRMVLE